MRQPALFIGGRKDPPVLFGRFDSMIRASGRHARRIHDRRREAWTLGSPIVWIVDAEHWPRACLRAELIERGYDALGFETVRDALTSLALPGTPRPQAVIVDLAGQELEPRHLEGLARGGAALVGIARAIDLAEDGSDYVQRLPWAALLRRPVSLGAIADTVDRRLGSQVAAPAP